MKGGRLIVLGLLVAYCLGSPVEDAIQELHRLIVKEQYTKTQPFEQPAGRQWHELKGVFRSWTHYYMVGGELERLFREEFKVPDCNGFVTAWTIEGLLEAEALGAIQVDDEVLDRAVESLVLHRDKNTPIGVPQYGFWTQRQNTTDGMWSSYPANLEGLLDEDEGIGAWLKKELERLHLEKLWDKIAFLLEMFPRIIQDAARIPSDADDTAAAIAVGAALYRYRDQHAPSLAIWEKENFHSGMPAVTERLLKSAYHADGKGTASWIDPRTFYWLRHHIQAHSDTSGFGTWMVSWEENKDLFDKGVSGMPYNINNLDASVQSNVVFTITSYVLSHPELDHTQWCTDDLRSVYVGAANVVAFAIDSGMVFDRPDLALLYYPPTADLVWMGARSLHMMDTYKDNDLPFPEMKQVRDILRDALRGSATKRFVRDANCSDVMCWWDDFMGDGDVDVFGRRVVRGEDRLFTTGAILQALIDTWTVPGKNQSCLRDWSSDAPEAVKAVVEKGSTFLIEYATGKKFRPYNAFFSASAKGKFSVPGVFPFNVGMYLNGTVFPHPHTASERDFGVDLSVAVAGSVSEATYQKWLGEKWFSQDVPVTFPGYNSDGFGFVYWNSPAFTYTVDVAALAKWRALEMCH